MPIIIDGSKGANTYWGSSIADAPQTATIGSLLVLTSGQLYVYTENGWTSFTG